MAFHPYLNFGGNCRQAFTRYKEIFGGELFLMPMSEVPAGDAPPNAQPEVIAHAALMFDDHLLMASDDPSGGFDGVQGMHVNYSVVDVDEARRVFEALSEGGQVTMALEETFFSPLFGMCVDPFGTPWMVNAEAPDEP